MTWLSCAICGSSSNEILCFLHCGTLDGSNLYPELRLLACSICGHVYNDLSPDEITGLGHYYNYEYAPANLNSIVKDGDLPGSSGTYTCGRYSQLYELLGPNLNQKSSVLDVGCAVGGFLDFLKERGVTGLFGVDVTEEYVARAREKNYHVQIGDAEELPFGDNSFDAVVVEQVLEHLVHPGKAFSEAGRVLKPGGVLCIGVPDASRYSDLYFYDFYWLLMREHIQHFSVQALSRLAVAHSFELIGFRQNSHPIMGEKMIMPNLSAAFRYAPDSRVLKHNGAISCSTERMRSYVAKECVRLAGKQTRIRDVALSRRPVYVWGIGREFLYLYEAAELKQCNLAGIIDMNPFKQQTVTIAGRSVVSDAILGRADRNSLLVITAIAHEEAIRRRAVDTGFRGEIISFT
jgi:SAM-dependent methyltransferase